LNDISQGYVIDYFGGSGTTAHAVIEINSERQKYDIGGIKFITVETNKYFDSVIIPRIKKVAASQSWVDGRTQLINGPGLFMRIQTLEQYDDTLQNLAQDTAVGDTGDLLADCPALALKYKLDSTARNLYMGLKHFSSPYGYQLQRATGGGSAQPAEVDLVESLPYLLGMDVSRLYREPQGVVLLGRNRRAESVAVFFRDCADANSADWVKTKLSQHPAERVYTNNPAALSFDGCDRLEAIEAVFALQFKRI